MTRRIALTGLAIGIAWVYLYAFIMAIGYAAALPISSRWVALFPTHRAAVLTWMVMWHTLAVLIVSAPFALFIQRVYGRRGVVVALLVTLSVFGLQASYLGELFHGQPLRLQIVAAFDQVKLLAVLPLLVWIFSRLLSNICWSGRES